MRARTALTALKIQQNKSEENNCKIVKNGCCSTIIADATISAVLSEPGGIFTVEEEQRTALTAFLGSKDDFALLPTG